MFGNNFDVGWNANKFLFEISNGLAIRFSFLCYVANKKFDTGELLLKRYIICQMYCLFPDTINDTKIQNFYSRNFYIHAFEYQEVIFIVCCVFNFGIATHKWNVENLSC